MLLCSLLNLRFFFPWCVVSIKQFFFHNTVVLSSTNCCYSGNIFLSLFLPVKLEHLRKYTKALNGDQHINSILFWTLKFVTTTNFGGQLPPKASAEAANTHILWWPLTWLEKMELQRTDFETGCVRDEINNYAFYQPSDMDQSFQPLFLLP